MTNTKIAQFDTYFTDKWIYETDTVYILHVGQTCSGKTYHAIEKLKQSENGCYLAPLRLLAWEIFEKLNSDNIKCSLITGEERQYIEGSNITSSTIEMLDYNRRYDTVVIDECFMISDRDRGKTWLKAILEVNAKEVHLILNNESENLIKNILTKSKKKFEIKKYERLTKLEVDTIPYKTSKPKDKTIFIVFSRRNALLQKYLFEKRGYNVSILYGNLPPETKKSQIEKFISGENTLCVSTDVVGMGLNLPCEHICFLEMEKFDGIEMRNLKSIEIKQIGGRAGRYGYSDIGYVCATQPHHINMIKHGLSDGTQIKKAYFGLDSEMFKNIPKEKLIDKLIYFEKLKCIPKELEGLITKQDVSIMKEIASQKDINKIDLDISWVLINSPVSNGNRSYFNKIIYSIIAHSKIEKPYFIDKLNPENDILSINDLETYEMNVSEIDLFSYFNNNKITRSFIKEDCIDIVMNIKGILISKIDKFLLDKSMSNIKKCPDCGSTLDITWQHKLCNDCFYKGRRRYWDEDEFDDEFDNDDDDDYNPDNGKHCLFR